MIFDLITIFGLAVTCFGAGLTAKAIMLSDDEALQIGSARYASGDREEDLELPMVQNLITAAKHARLGLGIVAAGTVIQMIAIIAKYL